MTYPAGVHTEELTDPERAAEAFAEVRPKLFGVAYRVLGSAAEAEDVVQDAWLRWQAYDRGTVRNPTAFLVTVTTRLALTAAQSARARRETYVGSWLPEPVDTSADPTLGAERAEALELAVLVLLEKLTPTERAAYVLREAFAYPYAEIAEVLQLTEVNCRQLVSRARRHVTDGRRATVGAAETRRLLEAFVVAARTGDLAALEKLFAADAELYSDGGGNEAAARVVIRGRDRVSRHIATFSAEVFGTADIGWVQVNGRLGVTVGYGDVLYALFTVTASADGIEQLLGINNPEKLTAFTPAKA